MSSSKTVIFGPLSVLVACFLASCSDCQPIPASGNRISIQFYRSDSLKSGNKRISLAKLLTKLEALGGIDTFPVQSKTGKFEIWLPNNADTAIFQFTGMNGREDLVVAFQRKLAPQPPECGAYIEFSGLSLVATDFDSVIIMPVSAEIQGFQLEIFDLP